MLYTQDQIKDILWKTFTIHAKDIKFLEQVGNEYWYEVTLEDGISNDDLGHIGLELHETDLFDVVNKGNNKMLVKYVGENDLMDVQEFRKFNETVNGLLNKGILLIKGANEIDGLQKLYAVQIKNIILLDNNAKMAILSDTFYRIYYDGTKLKQQLISWKNNISLTKILKMRNQSISIVLNNQKTPIWWNTLQYDNIAQMLYKIGIEIKSIEGIKWN